MSTGSGDRASQSLHCANDQSLDSLVSSPAPSEDATWETEEVSDVGTPQILGCTSNQVGERIPNVPWDSHELNQWLAEDPDEDEVMIGEIQVNEKVEHPRPEV